MLHLIQIVHKIYNNYYLLFSRQDYLMENIKPPFFLGVNFFVGSVFLLRCINWVEELDGDGKLPIGSDKVRSHGHTGSSFEFMNNGSGWLTLHLAHLSCRTLRTFSQPSLSHKDYQMLEIHLIAPKCLWWSEAVQQLTKTCPYSGNFLFFLWSWVFKYVWNWELKTSHEPPCNGF